MRRPRKFDERVPRKDEPRANERIRVPRVLVIGDEGQKLGEFLTEDAIALARDRGLDLIEVSPLLAPGAVVPEHLQGRLALLCFILSGEGLPMTEKGFEDLEDTLMGCYKGALGDRLFGTLCRRSSRAPGGRRGIHPLVVFQFFSFRYIDARNHGW